MVCACPGPPEGLIVVIGTTDVLFAVDSIPAIFAITTSPFVVWCANAFAVLGSHPLYFMLAGMMERFIYLQTTRTARRSSSSWIAR